MFSKNKTDSVVYGNRIDFYFSKKCYKRSPKVMRILFSLVLKIDSVGV